LETELQLPINRDISGQLIDCTQAMAIGCNAVISIDENIVEAEEDVIKFLPNAQLEKIYEASAIIDTPTRIFEIERVSKKRKLQDSIASEPASQAMEFEDDATLRLLASPSSEPMQFDNAGASDEERLLLASPPSQSSTHSVNKGFGNMVISN
jgi:hypothetical protein